MFDLIGNFLQSISVVAGAVVISITGLFGTAIPTQTEAETTILPPTEVIEHVTEEPETQSSEEKNLATPDSTIPQSVYVPIISEYVRVPTVAVPAVQASATSRDPVVEERDALETRINRLVADCDQMKREYDADILDLKQEFYDYRTAVYQAPMSARVMEGRIAQKVADTEAAIAQIEIEQQRSIMKCESDLAELEAN